MHVTKHVNYDIISPCLLVEILFTTRRRPSHPSIYGRLPTWSNLFQSINRHSPSTTLYSRLLLSCSTYLLCIPTAVKSHCFFDAEVIYCVINSLLLLPSTENAEFLDFFVSRLFKIGLTESVINNIFRESRRSN